MKRELPEKYYLDHFNEFISYIQSVAGELLYPEHQGFIRDYSDLDEAAQCLLVRLLNRNVGMVDQSTLNYSEIPNLQSSLSSLETKGFVRKVMSEDWPGCLTYLTKPQIAGFLEAHQVPFKSSAKKQVLVDQLHSDLGFDAAEASGLFEGFWIKARQTDFNYLLFLFFGNLDGRLNQFSLRDLGVIRTKGQQVQQQARFSSKDEARSSFLISQKLYQLKAPLQMLLSSELGDQLLEQLSELRTLIEASLDKPSVRQLWDKYTLKLARLVERENETLALDIYQQCAASEAEEKILRIRYKLGDRDEVQARLEALLEEDGSERLLLFAEDFLARKFHKKRTSKLTDVLRSAKVVAVDEMFRHNVEQGVCNLYRQQGIQAFETENRLWRALFGLTFWSELFESEHSICTEFDRLPACLLDGSFYSFHQESIDQQLKSLDSLDQFFLYLTKVSTAHYGTPNGVFRWRTDLLARLKHILPMVDLAALRELLLLMAQKYSDFSDGFPDLTVIEEGRIRFEEVKSPGDSLRKNQMVVLNKLQSLGFDASVTRVEWVTDPNQPYAVVDIETTGGTKGNHRITEIGAVKVVAGEVVDRWQSLVNPQRHISSFITNLTGITNEMVQDAPLFSDIAESLRVFLEGSIFVAHNVNFDYGFIKEEFARLEQSFSMPKLCTVKEMKRHYPGYESYGLGKICKEFDISLESHHRAMCDAEAAAQLLILINEKRFTAK